VEVHAGFYFPSPANLGGHGLAPWRFTLVSSCGEVRRPAPNAVTHRERRFWQPSRHPVQLETEAFWRAKLDYLHDDPCRKGLVRQAEHWRFSSAACWLLGDTGAGDVPLSGIVW